jgi:P pilus assembly chaperone PapD
MIKPGSILVAALVAAACLGGAARSPRAEGFNARPILIETRGGVSSITITNPGDRRIYLENAVYEWKADPAGQEILTESAAAIASPPAMWVQPRATYNLRVQLPQATDRELAFRVIIQQIPDKSEIQSGRVVFALTQRLPAFSEPAEAPPPAVLHARIVDPQHLLITNEGGRRARLADITADGRNVAPGLVGYALAHSSLAVTLKSPVRPGKIEVDTELGRRVVDLR